MNGLARLLTSLLVVCLLVVPTVLAEEYATRDAPGDDGGDSSSTYDPERTPPDDPCRPAWERLDERLQQLAQKYAGAHAELDAEAKRFYAQNHTDEERHAFEKEQGAKHDRLDQQEQNERDEAHAAFDRECQEAMKAAGHDPSSEPRPYAEYGERAEPHAEYGDRAEPMHREDRAASPPEWVSEECRGLMLAFDAEQRQRMDAAHKEIQAKWDAFEAQMRDRWDAFWETGDHTDEEVRAFEHELDAERDAFREKVRAHEEEARLEEEALLKRYRAKIESTCQPPEPIRPTMSADDGLPEEIAALQRECEQKMHRLEASFRAEVEAMEGTWNGSDDAEAERDFHERMRAKHDAFEAELRSLMRACEEEARVRWEEHRPDEAHDAPFDRMGSWSMSESGGQILLTGKYVSLVGDPATNTMGRIAIGGATFIQKLDTLGRLEFFDMDEAADGDSTLTATGEAIRLRLHDDPGGVMNLHADEAHAFLLTLPPSLEVAAGRNGWTLSGAASTALVRVAPGHSEWSEETRTLKVWGETTFLVKDAQNKVLPNVANRHRADLAAAAEDRRLGAEVTVAKAQDGTSVKDAVVYDGDVKVEVDTARVEDEAPVTITVSSHTLEEGRTFVVNVDEAVLGGRVKVAYFDVDEATGDETPAEIQKASGLTDILDANDDEAAEYWIVQDEDGIQVLVSVPHWSVHRFRLESEPDVGMELALPGPVALLVGITALAVAAARIRRRG